jgi:hypothetical protein
VIHCLFIKSYPKKIEKNVQANISLPKNALPLEWKHSRGNESIPEPVGISRFLLDQDRDPAQLYKIDGEKERERREMGREEELSKNHGFQLPSEVQHI